MDKGSFLENENQMVIDAEMQTIAEQLLDDWITTNYLKGRFNLFYDLKPEDDYYIEWDEEK